MRARVGALVVLMAAVGCNKGPEPGEWCNEYVGCASDRICVQLNFDEQSGRCWPYCDPAKESCAGSGRCRALASRCTWNGAPWGGVCLPSELRMQCATDFCDMLWCWDGDAGASQQDGGGQVDAAADDGPPDAAAQDDVLCPEDV